jgi:hypothetical protein
MISFAALDMPAMPARAEDASPGSSSGCRPTPPAVPLLAGKIAFANISFDGRAPGVTGLPDGEAGEQADLGRGEQ